MRTLPFVLVLTSCWSSSQPTEPPKGTAAPVDVAIASIRLADDCPDVAAAISEPAIGSMAGDCAAEGCGSFARACEQTLLQVSLRSTATDKTTVAVKKVELLDGDGNPIGSLTARAATRWTNDGSYTKWDQVVGAGEVMAASYALTSPDWTKVPGGRDPARKLRVRVTFTVGNGEKTFEKEAMIAAFSDPNVVT
jgi:hypothetical protein